MVSSCVKKNGLKSQDPTENEPLDSRPITYSQNPKTGHALKVTNKCHQFRTKKWISLKPLQKTIDPGSMDPVQGICLGEFHKDVEVLDILLQHRLKEALGEVSTVFNRFAMFLPDLAWHGICQSANEVTE